MLAVTLFAAVFAKEQVPTLDETAWGGFSAANCNSNTKEVGKCLNVFSDWAILSPTFGFTTQTCESWLPKSDDGSESGSCEDSTYQTGTATCCGTKCQAFISKTEDLYCSWAYGIDKKSVERLGMDCAETDDTTCDDFAVKIMAKTGTKPELVCKDTRCVPKKGTFEPTTTTTSTPETPATQDGNKVTPKPDSGAFAMGLSTLAGALVILQL